jgi:hypothetical protein
MAASVAYARFAPTFGLSSSAQTNAGLAAGTVALLLVAWAIPLPLLAILLGSAFWAVQNLFLTPAATAS